jgi:hypothetical protein
MLEQNVISVNTLNESYYNLNIGLESHQMNFNREDSNLTLVFENICRLITISQKHYCNLFVFICFI